MEKLDGIIDFVGIILSKIWNVAALILLGMIGKLSVDYMTGKKITRASALATIGAALFVGITTSLICDYAGVDEKQKAFLVPVATLLSEKIILSLIAINVVGLVRDQLKHWVDKLSGKK